MTSSRSLACVTTVSREVVEDSKREIHVLLMTVIAKAIALELDRVALHGAGGAPELQGVRNNPNVTVARHGATATWDNISGACS